MATKIRNLRALVGERVKAVVVAEDEKRHVEHGYLILEDETHVEIYVNRGGVSKRSDYGLDGVTAVVERNGFTVRGVWPPGPLGTAEAADEVGYHRGESDDGLENLATAIAEQIVARIPALRHLDAVDAALQRVADGDAGIEFELDDIVSLEDLDRHYATYVLDRLEGNKARAAEALGIDPSTLYRKLARWGIE